MTPTANYRPIELALGMVSASLFLGMLIGFVVYEPGLAVWHLLLLAIAASVALYDTVMMALEIIDRVEKRHRGE